MEAFAQDARHALTMMRRNPGFTAAAAITLALGIGATTAVFSVVYGVLLRPLPYPAADRLVRLSEEHPGANSPLRQPLLSNLTYHAWREGAKTVDSFAAYRSQAYTVGRPDGPVRLQGTQVTPSLFGLLGESAALGRFFQPEEGEAGNDAVLVLSDHAWHATFNADPSIVGRAAIVDGKPYQVVGVARPGFYFPDRDSQVWTPLAVRRPSPDAVAGRAGVMTVVNALARLAPGVTPAQAGTEGTAAARTTIRPMAANLLFGVGGAPVVHVRGIVGEMTARVRPAILVLAAAVVCVLLIACANVANLFLSRGVARQRELTVRAAIGASRGRLARQLLTESGVLSAVGGALGLALATALVRLAPLLAPRNFPRLDDVAIDARAVAFTAMASLVTALVSGGAPALRGSRFDLAASLHGGDGASAGGFRGARARRLRDGLLICEAAFAVVLLVAAGLLARSFVRLTHVDAGYSAGNVLAVEVFVPGGDADDRAEPMRLLVASMLERVRALPGVAAAGASNMMPLDGSTQIAGFPAPWTPPGSQRVIARSFQYAVTPGYAEALGLRLRRGRLFTDADGAPSVRPWIVNEEFARLYLPPDPIGYQWPSPAAPGAAAPINLIVGVVQNVLKNGNDASVQAEHYVIPHGQVRFFSRFELVVRTVADPTAAAPAIRNIVRELAPPAAVETTALSRRVAESVDEPRFAMTVLVAFASIAMLLASVGLYGVLSYAVSQRKREIGIRAALGASRRELVRLVLREGLAVTALGVIVGLAAAIVAGRLLQRLLFGVGPLDPIAFAIAPSLLLPIALLACALPALRAASVDPSESLRSE